MPGKRKRPSYARKSAAKKKAKKRARKAMVTNISRPVKLGLGFPKRLLMTHKYSEVVNITGSTSLGRYYWAVNSLYDPNVPGAGHQAMYFDQLTPLYNHYVVIGSKIKATFFPTSSITNTVMIAGVINDSTGAVAAADWSQVVEQSSAKKRIFIPSASGPQTITLKWSGKKNWGKGFTNNANMSGTAAANPNEMQFFDFYLIAADGTTSVSLRCEVMIEYIALWRELNDVTSS